MARVGRLAGAIVVETSIDGERAWFLVGDTKVPCDWPAAGFAKPAERDVKRDRFVRLAAIDADRAAAMPGTMLAVSIDGEDAARIVAERLTVPRTGAVSERLWRLVVGDAEADVPSGRSIGAAWLCEMPDAIWRIVCGAVLTCS